MLEPGELLSTMDAKVWADEFMETKARLGEKEFDHAMMLGWFANAIMAGFDEANRRAQRALDAEREKVKRLSTCGTDHSTPWWQVKCEDLEAQLATLQAQLADRDAMILQMGEQAAVLAKENMAVKAQLREVEGERDHAEKMEAVQKEVADNQAWHVRQLRQPGDQQPQAQRLSKYAHRVPIGLHSQAPEGSLCPFAGKHLAS